MRFTQLLTEVITRSRKIMYLESLARQVRKADNLTALYDSIVCYEDSLLFLFFFV
jgi:hypothetical protein